jgi:hypothetical protein
MGLSRHFWSRRGPGYPDTWTALDSAPSNRQSPDRAGMRVRLLSLFFVLQFCLIHSIR